MTSGHWVVFVEEPSMERFLEHFLPRVLPESWTFEIHAFQGKPDLLNNIGARLKAYKTWLPENFRVLVLVDRDADDCRRLKDDLERAAQSTGLRTKTRHPGRWQVANRVVIEELEAWYFGDWQAARTAFSGLPENTHRKTPFQDPDAIVGGTWEAFERLLQRAGHYPAGLAKVEAAGLMGQYLDPASNRSRSFQVFYETLMEAAA